MHDYIVNIDLWGLLTGTVTVAVGTVVAFVVKLLRKQIGSTALDNIIGLARTAVYAAEEFGRVNEELGGKLPGAAKLDYAVSKFNLLAKKAHINLDDEQVRATIEAALNAERPAMEAVVVPAEVPAEPSPRADADNSGTFQAVLPLK